MFVVPQFRIYLKPLLPKRLGFSPNPKKVLKAAQREILKSIREEIQKQAFSPRAKRALSKGVGTKIGENSIRVIAKHPAFYPLLEGQRRQQMTWLTKAVRPIPIILDDGELIFRNATPRSMLRGRWYHPGRRPTNVMEKARQRTREIVKTRIGKEVQRQIRAAMGIL